MSGGRCGGIFFVGNPPTSTLSFQLLVLLLSSLLQAHCDGNGSEHDSADLFRWRSLNRSAKRSEVSYKHPEATAGIPILAKYSTP